MKHKFLLPIPGRLLKSFLIGMLLICLTYAGGRLYYRLTDGFLESNIVYEMGTDVRWQTEPLSLEKKQLLQEILSQPYYYLAKGCQSYVFVSKDDKYVIKFFKYQRFRPQKWLDSLTFLPFVSEYRESKIAKKKLKLDNAFSSWKLAYEELQHETGVVYVHFNKTDEVSQELEVFDKLGYEHRLSLNGIEFMVQKKTDMLCPILLKLKNENNHTASTALLDRLFAMLLSEYARGYADNDHALMQNTGVDNGHPIHIDVGQFVKNPNVTEARIYHQEIFNKTWKFRIWLQNHYPFMADYTKSKLEEIIGDRFEEMRPTFDKSSMGRIPNL